MYDPTEMNQAVMELMELVKASVPAGNGFPGEKKITFAIIPDENYAVCSCEKQNGDYTEIINIAKRIKEMFMGVFEWNAMSFTVKDDCPYSLFDIQQSMSGTPVTKDNVLEWAENEFNNLYGNNESDENEEEDYDDDYNDDEIKAIEDLTEYDFSFDDMNTYIENSVECTFKAWGEKWNLYISIEQKKEDGELQEEYLPVYTDAIKRHIKWIDNNKQQFIQAMLDDDILETAEDWASSEEEERDGKTYYILEDGEIEAPVTEEMFVKSIKKGGINLSVSKGHYLYEIFFRTQPDFFAGHDIEVWLEVDDNDNYKIKMGGLAG
jgi:hypothetical protein